MLTSLLISEYYRAISASGTLVLSTSASSLIRLFSLYFLVSLVHTGPQAGHVFYLNVSNWLSLAALGSASSTHSNVLDATLGSRVFDRKSVTVRDLKRWAVLLLFI